LPIYEYRCQSCGRKSSKLHRSFSQQAQVSCDHCNSPDLDRLISRVTLFRSDEIGDVSYIADVDESDPRALTQAMKRMQREMGDDAGAEVKDAIEMLEAGVSPDEMSGGMDGDDDF